MNSHNILHSLKTGKGKNKNILQLEEQSCNNLYQTTK